MMLLPRPIKQSDRPQQSARKFVDELVHDLRLACWGYKPDNPITIERLEQWSKHRDRL